MTDTLPRTVIIIHPVIIIIVFIVVYINRKGKIEIIIFLFQLNLQDNDLIGELHENQTKVGFGNPELWTTHNII